METILASPTFVINLPRCSDRLRYSTEQLKKAGYTQVSVFEAVDGKDSSSVKEALALFHYEQKNEMNQGALGCLLSHMKLYKSIIEQNIPITNIFEDDIHFHPEWDNLSRRYYALTPTDYEVLFIGNQLELTNQDVSEITSSYCYCTHAYIVTLEGAKKLLNLILQFIITRGLFEIDCLLMTVLNQHKSEGIPSPIVLYSWNGTKYPCSYNTTHILHCRNTGLVFQNLQFLSQIDQSKILTYVNAIRKPVHTKHPVKKMVML